MPLSLRINIIVIALVMVSLSVFAQEAPGLDPLINAIQNTEAKAPVKKSNAENIIQQIEIRGNKLKMKK